MSLPPSRERAPVNPQMVTLGRESRGLIQRELAAQLGVTQGRISKVEMGQLPVTDELLERLCTELDYPEEFFRKPGGISGVGLAELFHRKRQDVPKKILDQIYANIEIRCIHHISNLLKAAEIPCNIPRFDIDQYEGDAERIADLLRSHWELPRGPIESVTEAIENAGGIIVRLDLGTRRVDAISRWLPGMNPVFFMNSLAPTDRLRYSLAHELGHMVMHELPSMTIEDEANRFAAEFLMPEREISPYFYDGVNLPKLANLKLFWKVSIAALLKRAEDIGSLTKNQARYLWTQLSSIGYRQREPIELDPAPEKPTLLAELIQTHRNDLGFTKEELGRLLALNAGELAKLYLNDLPENESSQPIARKIRAL